MAIRLSDAAAILMLEDVGLRRAINGCNITLFTGSQPMSANDGAGSMQPIINFTKDDGVYTETKQATWSVSFSAVSGTVYIPSISVGGLILIEKTVSATSESILASTLAQEINEAATNLDFSAVATAGTLVITAPHGTGAAYNNAILEVSSSGSVTITFNDPSHNGGVFSAGVNHVNGLSFAYSEDDGDSFSIKKDPSETWKGKNGYGPATSSIDSVYNGITNGNTYTAGWGRICVSEGDTGLDSTSGINGYIRIDFSVGSANADCIITPSPTFTVNTNSGQENESVFNQLKLNIAKKM